jgi:hypothetical protein
MQWPCCEHGNVPLGFIKGVEFFDQLSDYKLLKKNSVDIVLVRLTTV